MPDKGRPADRTRRDADGDSTGHQGDRASGALEHTRPPENPDQPGAASRTRRDPGDPEPPGPNQTRRDAVAGPPALFRLPSAIADRFTVLGELPAYGAESDLLHVSDPSGAEYVVKIFRRGFTADRPVWRTLPTLDSPYIVRIAETGHADGRDFEVIEYVPGGNLRGLGSPVSHGQAAELVAQLAEGLARLHEAGIVHRDLKPENVLVRSADPLRLAITDFGLSKAIEQSVVFASSSRTLAYAAPESLSGQVSPARDWWSLGIIVRELLTGHAPFAGMSETTVVDHLATRSIDCSDVADERMRLLCRGLLTRDPRTRWTGREITQWLEGGRPAVTEPVSTGRVTAGLPFRGRTYTDRTELASDVRAHWAEAARFFFGGSEGWRVLRDWLAGFHESSRIELVDAHLTADLPPDVKLLHLLHWLDPSLPPHYLGRRLLPGDLPDLVADAESRTEPGTAARAGRDLWEHRLLPVLARFGGGEDLTDIDARWREHVAEWDSYAAWLREQLPVRRVVDASADQGVRMALLALAADPEGTRSVLAGAADRARETVPEPVRWFSWLSDSAGDDPLRLLAVARAGPEATLEAEAARRRRGEAEHREAEQRHREEELERQRLAGRGAAVRKAIAWCLPIGVFWYGVTWVIIQMLEAGQEGRLGGFGEVETFAGPMLVLSGLAWLTQTGSEVFLARKQAGDYLPMGPWPVIARVTGTTGRALSGTSRRLSGATRRTSRGGCLVIGLLTVLPLLFFLAFIALFAALARLVWLMLLVAVPIAHVAAVSVRLHRWQRNRASTLGSSSAQEGGIDREQRS